MKIWFDTAADEIDRLRGMCQRREEFIAQKNLWGEFSKWLSEPTDTGSPTRRALAVLGNGEWQDPEELDALLAKAGVKIVSVEASETSDDR